MTREPITGLERLIKSVDRVRDLAEVFTPASTVQQMLNLLPPQMWVTHPSPTFLEPACGDGNFLVGILYRKLDRVADEYGAGTLAAGGDDAAVVFHALEALASIYAVDISPDNVIGGTPGHEVGARGRLLLLLANRLAGILQRPVDGAVMHAACWIVERNIQVGNMLPSGADGTPSRRDALPLREYAWQPETRTVTVRRTTLGAVLRAESTGAMTLFDSPEPAIEWQGPVGDLGQKTEAVPHQEVAATGHGRS